MKTAGTIIGYGLGVPAPFEAGSPAGASAASAASAALAALAASTEGEGR